VSNLTFDSLPPLGQRWLIRADKLRSAVAHRFKSLDVAVTSEVTIQLPLGAHRSFWSGVSPDHDLLEFLAHMLPDNGLFLDIGANLGVYSTALWKMRGRMRGAAFEPIPTTQALLRQTFELNDVPCSIEKVAISDVPRTLKLSAYEHGHNNFWIVNDDKSHPTLDVAALPLDAWSAEQKDRVPGAIKIDVEGHELSVIKGARQTLAKHRPALVVECHAGAWPKLSVPAVEFDQEIRSLGYRRLCDRRGRPVDVLGAHDTFYLLALP
jgi:FkbM family methyltransferase